MQLDQQVQLDQQGVSLARVLLGPGQPGGSQGEEAALLVEALVERLQHSKHFAFIVMTSQQQR